MSGRGKQRCCVDCSNIMNNFRALVVKTFLLGRRKRGQTIAEIILPYIFLGLFLALRYIMDRQHFPAYQMPRFAPYQTMLFNGSASNVTYYYPANNCTTTIVTNAMSTLKTIWSNYPNNVQVIPDPTLASLSNTTLQSIHAFIYFTNADPCTNPANLPDDVSYTLRMQENGPYYYHAQKIKLETGDYYWKTAPEQYCQGNTSIANYTTQFLGVQYLIDLSIIQYVTNVNQSLSNIFMNHFGCPQFDQDPLQSSFSFFVPIFFSIIYVVTFILNVGYIVEERENKTKEYLRIFGLRTWINNSVWVIRAMCFFFVITGIVTALSFVKLPSTNSTPLSVSKAVFNLTHWTVIWTILFVYSIQVSTFSVLFGQFFRRPLPAKVLAFVIWILTFIDFYSSAPVGVRYFMCLFPNTGLLFCLQVVLQYERKSSGLTTYDTLYSNLFPYPLYIGICLLMMLVYSVIYMFLAIYVERINPGEFGVSQPWYYLFMKSYWRPHSPPIVHPTDIELKSSHSHVMHTSSANPWIQLDTTIGNKLPSVVIDDLDKKFGKFRAISDLSLRFYSGEVCSLLGHNGAGKTTTTFILVGMLEPTSGSVMIEGLNSSLHIEEIRKILGFCPQYDILYDELSAQEHLELAAQMRHMKREDRKESIKHTLDLIGLTNDRLTLSKDLSGGMKRRLSIGISMIGDPKVLILDEPTSGIDPYNRRLIWTIIRKMKDAGKCIILTTHFLEEADALSDRIAIMSNGRLQASGTPDFLKNQTDFEYHLFIDKQDTSSSESIKIFVQDLVQDVVLEREITSEMVFGIKRGQSEQTGKLINALDRQSGDIGISGYGLTMASIEDVFLKLVREQEAAMDGQCNRPHHVLANEVFRTVHARIVGARLFWYRFYALLVKRWILLRRQYVFVFGIFILPIVLEILVVAAIPTPQTIQSSITGNDRVKDAQVTFQPSLYNSQTVVTYSNNDGNFAHARLIDYLNGQGATIEEISTDTVLDYVRERYYETEDIFVNKYQLGFSLYNNLTSATASVVFNSYFSTVNYHTMPTSLAVSATNLFQFYANSSSKSIITTNQPILSPAVSPSFFTTFFDQLYCFDILPQSLFNFLNSILVSIFISVLMITYIQERLSHSKDLQLLTKLTKSGYWISNFIFDLTLCLAISIILIIIIKIAAVSTTNEQAEVYIYQPTEQAGYFFLMIIMYCLASLPLVYNYSFIPKTEILGFIGFLFINALVNFIDVILIFVAVFSQAQSTPGQISKASKLLTGFRYILAVLLPSVNFKHALTNIRLKSSPTCIAAVNAIDNVNLSASEPWMSTSDPGLGGSFIIFIVQIVVWWIILSVIEQRVHIKENCGRCCCSCSDSGQRHSNNTNILRNNLSSTAENWDETHLDEDVQHERRLVLQGDAQTTATAIICRDLVQKFKKRKAKSLKSRVFVAVDHLSFRVMKQSCFGLLGANGAGKTTTFRMLINDLKPSGGEILLDAKNVHGEKENLEIGFCPQFDWLMKDLTVEETLTLFARLKGLKGAEIPKICQDMIELFGLNTYENKVVHKLSGGNKRKVSAVVSFMANPTLVFLDEPTTGLDADAKRKIWHVIRAARDVGLTIVMTSHSMEECEALCTKIGIMKAGQFMCLGSLQRLKNRFGTGYAMQVKVLADYTKSVTDELTSRFSGIQIEDRHNGVLFCNIPFATPEPSSDHTSDRLPFSLARVFEVLDGEKKSNRIESYSVTQTTLEQIFVRLTGEGETNDAASSTEGGRERPGEATIQDNSPAPPETVCNDTLVTVQL